MARLDGELKIAVQDNGIGVPAARLDTLFTMFSQVASTMGRSEGGLGVGLALVKGIAELHGGRVEARNEGPGKGSRFVIALPFEARLESEPTFEEVIGAPQSGRLRVLIVDDNRGAADSLSVLLSMDGPDVRTVYGGRAAVSAAETFRPDVALLDIGMPEVEGYAAARAIRALRGSVDTHLVAITGWGSRRTSAGRSRRVSPPISPSPWIPSDCGAFSAAWRGPLARGPVRSSCAPPHSPCRERGRAVLDSRHAAGSVRSRCSNIPSDESKRAGGRLSLQSRSTPL
jgi:CheY-like chemotaxis protein